jgi:hypothetical protein
MTDVERAARKEFNPTPWRTHDLERLIYAEIADRRAAE